MGCVSREMETLRKNQKEMLEINNTAKEMKNAFDGLSVDWTQLRGETVILNISHQKIPKWKDKKLKREEKKKKRT